MLRPFDSRVVTALAHVNMIVGVNRLLRAEFTTKDLNGTVRNNLYSVEIN